MKKIFIAVMTTLLAFVSCKENLEPRYNITISAEGIGEFSWFSGKTYIEGSALVHQCNDTTLIDTNAVSLRDAVKSDNIDMAETAAYLLGLLTVEGVEGGYRFSADGYVAYGPYIFLVDEKRPEHNQNNDDK